MNKWWTALFFVPWLAVASCLSCTVTKTQPLLTPAEVLSRTKETDATLLTKRIASLWADIERGRKVIQLGLVAGYPESSMTDLYFQLEVVDYYMTRAWTHMIEGNEMSAVESVAMGEHEMDALKERVLEIFRDVPKEPEAEKQSL